jgi:hypothetical protein
VFALFESSFAQKNDSWKIPSERRDSTGSKFTGNLIEDSKIALSSYNKNLTAAPVTIEGRKSPFLAGLFSLLIPGFHPELSWQSHNLEKFGCQLWIWLIHAPCHRDWK